jgi:hypothetical protein
VKAKAISKNLLLRDAQGNTDAIAYYWRKKTD